jgi:hypothetical protein
MDHQGIYDRRKDSGTSEPAPWHVNAHTVMYRRSMFLFLSAHRLTLACGSPAWWTKTGEMQNNIPAGLSLSSREIERVTSHPRCRASGKLPQDNIPVGNYHHHCSLSV